MTPEEHPAYPWLSHGAPWSHCLWRTFHSVNKVPFFSHVNLALVILDNIIDLIEETKTQIGSCPENCVYILKRPQGGLGSTSDPLDYMLLWKWYWGSMMQAISPTLTLVHIAHNQYSINICFVIQYKRNLELEEPLEILLSNFVLQNRDCILDDSMEQLDSKWSGWERK